MPAAIGDIAYQNKAVIYDLLFKAPAETMITIAADPKHLGARIGVRFGIGKSVKSGNFGLAMRQWWRPVNGVRKMHIRSVKHVSRCTETNAMT